MLFVLTSLNLKPGAFQRHLVFSLSCSAIRDEKNSMPRRLPEKRKYVERKPRRFESRRFISDKPLFQKVPVKENQELEVVIDDIGSRGDGIARIQGYLIFVPNSRVGERVKVRITSVGGRFAIAERIS
jgi:Predicted RNA-binding protein, contains TRAM domain